MKSAAPLSADSQPAARQYLTFRLAGEEYGIDILNVQEIRGWDAATRIPESVDYMLGVVNLRGIVVPAMDLRLRLGFEPAVIGSATVMIVVKVPGAVDRSLLGLLVDAVSEVRDIAEVDIQPTPPLGAGVDANCLRGIASHADGMIILLDLHSIAPASAAASQCA